MASRNNRQAYFDDLMPRDCEEPGGDMVFPIDHDDGSTHGPHDEYDDNDDDDDGTDMVFEMDDPGYDEPHSDVSGATPTSYNVFNFHSRSMSHSLSSVGGGMQIRPTPTPIPPRQTHSRSRSSLSTASASRPTSHRQRPALQTSQIFPLSAPSARPLAVSFSPSQSTGLHVTGGRDTFMGFQQDNTDGDLRYFDTPAFASASARAHELQQAQYYALQTQVQSSPGPMTIPSSSSYSASPRLQQQQNLQPHHVPGQLHPHHPQHSRYYHVNEAEMLARQSLESASHPSIRSTTTTQFPYVGHESQAYWSTNMVLSTTESVGIDPAELVNPCSLSSLASCQTPVADRSTAVAVQNQKAWKEQQEKDKQNDETPQMEVNHQKSLEQQVAEIQRQQEHLVSQRRKAQLRHLAQTKEEEKTRQEKDERLKLEVAAPQREPQESSTSVYLYESFLALRALLETEQRRQQTQQALPPPTVTGQTSLQATLQPTLHAGIQKRAAVSPALENANAGGHGHSHRTPRSSRSIPPRSAHPSTSPFVPPPPDNLPLPSLPHNFPHPPRRPPVARPLQTPSSSSSFTPSPLAAPFVPSTTTSDAQPNQPVIAHGSKPYRGGYVPVADQTQNQNQNKLYYQYQHYTYQPSVPMAPQPVQPQTQHAHDASSSSVRDTNVSAVQPDQSELPEQSEPPAPPSVSSPLVVRRQLTAASSHRTAMYTPYAPYSRQNRVHTSPNGNRRIMHAPRNPRALRAVRAIRPAVGNRGAPSSKNPVVDQGQEREDGQHGESNQERSPPSHEAPSPRTPSSTTSTTSTSTILTPPTSAASSMPSSNAGGQTTAAQAQSSWSITATTQSSGASDGDETFHTASASPGQISITNSSLFLKPAPSFTLFPTIHHRMPTIPDARSRERRLLADKKALAMTPIIMLPMRKELLAGDWHDHPSTATTMDPEAVGDSAYVLTANSHSESFSRQTEEHTTGGGDAPQEVLAVDTTVAHVEPHMQPRPTHTSDAATAASVITVPLATLDEQPFTSGQAILLRMPPTFWVSLFHLAAHQAYVHHCRLVAQVVAHMHLWKMRSVPPPLSTGASASTAWTSPWRWTWMCLCRRRHVVLLRLPRFMCGPQWCDRCGDVEPERREGEGEDDGDDDVDSGGDDS
ncbi:hypothetical protein Sste5346_004683 [Sporothrix stenoceras]|uniref:Uncharacterized protein n=1 Tax=Sporothrix stenoceras TaxID=5173 RepID=A0ABR3Z7I1_9PEZI